jgi:hypothetical protein
MTMISCTLTYNRSNKFYDVKIEKIDFIVPPAKNQWYFENVHQAIGILIGTYDVCGPSNIKQRVDLINALLQESMINRPFLAHATIENGVINIITTCK